MSTQQMINNVAKTAYSGHRWDTVTFTCVNCHVGMSAVYQMHAAGLQGPPCVPIASGPVSYLTQQELADMYPAYFTTDEAPAAPDPKCECGGKSAGARDYAPGHSSWCDVSEGKS